MMKEIIAMMLEESLLDLIFPLLAEDAKRKIGHDLQYDRESRTITMHGTSIRIDVKVLDPSEAPVS